MLEVEIYISLKKTVSDPQGLAIKHALDSLHFGGIEEVRMGKLIIIRLDTKNKKEARETIDTMCRKVLANPIIEDYHFKIKEL